MFDIVLNLILPVRLFILNLIPIFNRLSPRALNLDTWILFKMFSSFNGELYAQINLAVPGLKLNYINTVCQPIQPTFKNNSDSIY